jgi:drug/metabolite transporter (DMT)-like permease
MSLAALGLLFAAAVLHAGWNVLVKRAKQKQVFTWWAILVGALCFSPILIVNRPLPLQIWPYVAGSALFEALYFVGLTRAYDIDDFSLVYPLARGAAPALLVVWAALFLGERPRPAGLAGLTLLVLGLVIVGSAAWWSQRQIARPSLLGVAMALATACCISIYSAIDGAAVHLVPSAPYTVVILGLSALLIAPALLLRYGSRAVVAEWRTNWLRILLVGILSVASYGLVLAVYSFSRISYAGAIREISIVLAAFIGWRWLGEGFGSVRLVGAVLIFAGILVIAIAG